MIPYPPSYYRDILNALEDQVASSTDIEKRKHEIMTFVNYVLEYLECDQKPGITLSTNKNKAQQHKSFGQFDLNSKKIWVYISNRNLADILRTTCHEIIHYKQMLDGKISGPTDGNDGSDIENEANSVAAIILRQYGRNNAHIFE